jgi:tetratricopeptide (TPR) repeat protein
MYRRALEIDPESVEAHFNMAVAFADAQIFQEAIREWREVIRLEPDGRIAQVSRDNIQMIEDYIGGQ